MFSLLYIVLAILALSFLIFIHELGHYWMARRVGMRVEVFSIGFGNPIYFWMKDGVKWQIGWLPFGGYVKIAGTETEEGEDPYAIKDGFFGKTPWERAKVAFMGPFVNLVFALLAFGILWIAGGRDKNFSEFTSKIGWVDENSDLYVKGVRPGDEIVSYDGLSYTSQKDHLYAPLLGEETLKVEGNKVNYETGEREEFAYDLKTYPHPNYTDNEIKTVGVLGTANYMIYDRINGEENPLLEGAPIANSGLQYGDRVFWVDGELIFSKKELTSILNDGRVLLTIERGGETFLRRVPLVSMQELRLTPNFKEELIDWQYEAGIGIEGARDLNVIPYDLAFDGVVEKPLKFLEEQDEIKYSSKNNVNNLVEPLAVGDRIIAVQGVAVTSAPEILKQVQEKKVNIIVERDPAALAKVSWKEADESFNQNIDFDNLAKIVNTIGTSRPVKVAGDFHLLKPVTPKVRTEFQMSEKDRATLALQLQKQKQMIEEIDDPQLRQRQLDLLDERENELILGFPAQDRQVIYNPSPTALFGDVSEEISRNLSALVTGKLSPKHFSGPVGIVSMVQTTLQVSFAEALFWLGAISLNLGVLNLLPIPVLDGGTIVLSFFEMITRRRVHPKALEKLVLVFAVLLIAFFLFLTYQDVSRLTSFF